MLAQYREMLGYVETAVTRSMSEKKLGKILEHISDAESADLLHEVYTITLQSLRRGASGGPSDSRLWFKTSILLGRLCLRRGGLGCPIRGGSVNTIHGSSLTVHVLRTKIRVLFEF